MLLFFERQIRRRAVKKDEVIVAVEKDGIVYQVPFSYASFAKFENRHGVGSVARMAELLASDCNSFIDIGRMMGTSRQSVQQWYESHMSRHLPSQNGRIRRRICILSKPRRKTLPDYMLRLWNQARRRNIPVAQINAISTQGKVRGLRTALSLGGVHTSVHYLKNKRTVVGSHHLYVDTHAHIVRSMIMRFPVHCFITSRDELRGLSENYFFIPQKDLEAYMGRRSRAGIHLPLVERQPGYAGKMLSRNDWRKFGGENGWDIMQALCAQSPDP